MIYYNDFIPIGYNFFEWEHYNIKDIINIFMLKLLRTHIAKFDWFQHIEIDTRRYKRTYRSTNFILRSGMIFFSDKFKKTHPISLFIFLLHIKKKHFDVCLFALGFFVSRSGEQ